MDYKYKVGSAVSTVSGQRLEWTKVRAGEKTHCATNFNKIKNQCEQSIIWEVLKNIIVHAVHWPKYLDF